jgi:uncharacterized protein
MSHFIDRRQQASKRNTVNRQRFMRRCKDHIQKAVSNAINKRSITNMSEGEKITIPTKDLEEPEFQRASGGYNDQILPGNKDYISGDRIKRQEKNAEADGSDASDNGEGNDEFIFELSRDEFLEIYFADLELPDLIKKELAQIQTIKTIRGGVTNSGTPTNMNIIRSLRHASGRRIALSAPYKRDLRIAESNLQTLLENPCPNKSDQIEIQRLTVLIDQLKQKINKIPFIDNIDVKYNNRIHVPSPSTQAVMFCLMDVSGSMDEAKKDIAKRFFILLYLFLTKNYAKIELVFIRHHTSAKIVNENDFFYSRETGGTVVSSALDLLTKTIHNQYHPAAWNIYVAQASDGDNWNADSPYCLDLLRDKIMPYVQYFSYIEIMPRHHQSLWEVYQQIHQSDPHFAMASIEKVSDVYPVFHELFKRKAV